MNSIEGWVIINMRFVDDIDGLADEEEELGLILSRVLTKHRIFMEWRLAQIRQRS